MAENKEVPRWKGLLNPVRLLVPEEIEVLGEICTVCGMAAHVVELQRPLKKGEADKGLSEFEDAELRYTCALHAPIDVPTNTSDDVALAFYEEMRQPLICPDKRWQKYYVTCLELQMPCLAQCPAIKCKLHVSVEEAGELVRRGKALAKRRKEERDADTE